MCLPLQCERCENLQIQVVDLTPDDGIAAGLSFSGIYNYESAEAVLFVNGSPVSYDQSWQGNSFDPVSIAAPVPDGLPASADAQYAGGSSEGAFGASAYSGSRGRSYAQMQLGYDFTLAPHTELRFSWTASASAETPVPNSAFYDVYSGSVVHFNHEQVGQAWAFASEAGVRNAADVHDFSYVLSNDHDAPLASSMFARLWVDATQSPAVPEPHSAWLLVTGLLLLAGVLARRRA